MKIKHWIKLVKNAIKATRESDRAWQAYFIAEDKIHQRAPLFEIYNKEFKKGLGVNFCQLTYGMDKNLFEPLQNPNAYNCSCLHQTQNAQIKIARHMPQTTHILKQRKRLKKQCAYAKKQTDEHLV